jgi:hypothetical protein
MERKKYLQVRESLERQGIPFEEIGIDENPNFNSSVKGSQGYRGCVPIGLCDNNEGVLFHYSHFPSSLKREFEAYLTRLGERKGLNARVNLYGGFAETDQKVLEEIFRLRGIPVVFSRSRLKLRDIIFYPGESKMRVFRG